MRLGPNGALLDEVYDSVVAPERWPKTLTSVSHYIGAVFMSIVPYKDPSGIYMSAGGEYAIQSYRDHWFRYDAMVGVGIANRHRRDLICDWDAIGLEEIARNSYYQEYRRDAGMGYCIGSTFEAFPGEYHALGINLPLSKEPLDADALKDIEFILQHVARAIKLSTRTEALSLASPAFHEVFDTLQASAAIVDCMGNVAAANKALKTLADDGLLLRNNRLICASPKCQRDLDRLIHGTAAGATDNAEDFIFIDRPSGRRSYLARAVPLSRRSAETIWRSLPQRMQVLLLIVDLEAEGLITSANALTKFGLTAAEANVAALVGSGMSARRCAERLGTAESTVRTQMKQIFSKMELRRQADLMRIVETLRKAGY